MHLRCPHCQNPIELADLPSGGEITCVGCGSSFQLDQFATATFTTTANKRLGKFEILSTVGHGAFGTVLKARDTELDRTVAIKVPRAGNVGPKPADVDRFLREARSVAQLRFPSIISIHEVGADNGTPYLVCDFVEGITLADMLTGRGFSFRESAKLLAAVADALQYAHSLGVVHRDVKPSNIMIRPDGSPCVMDFGLAKRDAGEITMTIDGQILGTPAYMSPEQARGDAHKVDGRSDVYSLGVILYQLLTNELPFRGNKAMLLHQVLHEEPQRPRALNDKIPRDPETIALKAMAKEPGRRYGSANEMAEDLRRWLAGEPILARPVGAVERLWRWCKRKPALAGMTAALATVVMIALAVVSWELNVTTAALEREGYEKRQRALAQVTALRDAAPGAVPAILADLSANRATVLAQLRASYSQELRKPIRMRLALALVEDDPTLRDELAAWMLEVPDPAEVPLLRDALAPHQRDLLDQLWAVVENEGKDTAQARLRAAAALAKYDLGNRRWDNVSGQVAEDLVGVNPVFLGVWSDALRPVKGRLLAPLSEIFRDQRPERIAERKQATGLLADYAADKPQILADLLMDADEKQFATIFPKFKEQTERGLPVLFAEIDKKPVIVKEKIVFEKEGKIAEDDARVKPSIGSPIPSKRFEVRLQAGKQYRLTMDSKELDSYLVLQDKAGKKLAEDDDSGGGLNSLLLYTPSSDDSYTVHAAALQNQKETKNTGGFVLKIVETLNPDENKEKLAKRQANAAVALLRMKQEEKVWPLLKRSQAPDDPRVRSYLIHRFGPLGADVGAIVKHLDKEPDITIQRGLILSLGEFTEKDWSVDDRDTLTKKLQKIYSMAADPGLHAASEWLLRHWKYEAWLKQTDDKWAKDGEQREKRLDEIKRAVAKAKEKTPPRWYVNGQGQTMVVISGPVEFMMGSPLTEADRRGDEYQHKRRIGRTFALASKPVTMEQYREFQPGKKYDLGEAKYQRIADLPAVGISWPMAAAYCNRLSKEEGMDEDQWCYEININGPVIRLKENYLRLTGYRLPTEAEMEYATRAGAVTSRYFGETEELLPKYAWYTKNAQVKTWPVGSLKPNDLGLFDVQGNVFTWCQESYKEYPTGKGEEAYEDREDGPVVLPAKSRLTRGGSFGFPASFVRNAYRGLNAPVNRDLLNGFRVARTLSLDGGK